MLRLGSVAVLVLAAALAGCAGEDDGLGRLSVHVRAGHLGDSGEGEIRCPDSDVALGAGVTCGFIDEHRDVILFGVARPLNACRGGPPTVRVTGTWRRRAVHRELVGCAPGQGGAGAQLLMAAVLGDVNAAYAKGYVRCESEIPGAGWDALLKRGECTRRVGWRLDPRRRVPRTVAGCVTAWNRYAHTHRRHAARALLPQGLERVRVSLVRAGGRPTGCQVRFAGADGSFAFRARWLGPELRWRGHGAAGPRAGFRPNVRVNENADLRLPR